MQKTTLGLNIPQSGAPEWGTMMNTNIIKLDSLIQTIDNKVIELQSMAGETGYVAFEKYPYVNMERNLDENGVATTNFYYNCHEEIQDVSDIDNTVVKFIIDIPERFEFNASDEGIRTIKAYVGEKILDVYYNNNSDFNPGDENSTKRGWCVITGGETATFHKPTDTKEAGYWLGGQTFLRLYQVPIVHSDTNLTYFIQVGNMYEGEFQVPETNFLEVTYFSSRTGTAREMASKFNLLANNSETVDPNTLYYSDLYDYSGHYVATSYTTTSPLLDPPFNQIWEAGEIFVKISEELGDGSTLPSFIKFKQSFGGYYTPTTINEDGELVFKRMTPSQTTEEVYIGLPQAANFILNDNVYSNGTWNGTGHTFTIPTGLFHSEYPIPPVYILNAYLTDSLETTYQKVYADEKMVKNGEYWDFQFSISTPDIQETGTNPYLKIKFVLFNEIEEVEET